MFWVDLIDAAFVVLPPSVGPWHDAGHTAGAAEDLARLHIMKDDLIFANTLLFKLSCTKQFYPNGAFIPPQLYEKTIWVYPEVYARFATPCEDALISLDVFIQYLSV